MSVLRDTTAQEPKFFVGSIVVGCSVLLYNDELISRDWRGKGIGSGSADVILEERSKLSHIAPTNRADLPA